MLKGWWLAIGYTWCTLLLVVWLVTQRVVETLWGAFQVGLFSCYLGPDWQDHPEEWNFPFQFDRDNELPGDDAQEQEEEEEEHAGED